ncbi:MAG: CBS domain-containing protein, partial [Halobacteriota archaeon]
MFKSFRIGSVFGIPLRLDVTFLLVLPLFAWIIGSQIGELVDLLDPLVPVALDADPLVGGSTHWLVGLAAAVGLFASVVLHELGHSLVAIRYGFPIDSITLWIFGGIAQLTDMPEDWRQELLIALAGPAVSVGVGAVAFAGLYAVTGPPVATFLLAYLAVMNVALAAFNMLPAFPMDGGRVLRALLARTRPFADATRTASEVGKLLAFVMGIIGLLGFNIILIGIAFFIYIAASSEAQRVMTEAALAGVVVEDVMTPVDRLRVVAPDTTVSELVGRMFRERHTGYPVLEDGRPVGIVTLSDAREVREVEQDAFEVHDIMSTDLETIAPGAPAIEAITQMQAADVGRLLVIDEDGTLQGLISRSDIMHALEIAQTSQWIPATAKQVG